MERLLNENDVRMGIEVSRKQNHGQAPDSRLLTNVANLVLEQMGDGTQYEQAVESALNEINIDKSVRKLFCTALHVTIGKHTKEMIPSRHGEKTQPIIRAQTSSDSEWKRYFEYFPGHYKDATALVKSRDSGLTDP
jgi:hypothetical protein